MHHAVELRFREAFAICNVVEQHRRIRLYPPKYDDPNLL